MSILIENITVNLKKILMYITLIWSVVMLAVYLVVLFELPIFAFISFLPFGEFIADVLTFLLLSGIWAVPVLYIITLILMIVTRMKFEDAKENKAFCLSTALLPLFLAILMLATNFLELLA